MKKKSNNLTFQRRVCYLL